VHIYDTTDREMTISLVAALHHFILPNRYSSIEIFGRATAKKGDLDRLIVAVSRPQTHTIIHKHTQAREHGKTILKE